MAKADLLYKEIPQSASIPSIRYAGRGRIVAPNGFGLSVKYEYEFCSRKEQLEGIVSGNLIRIDRNFFYELKLLISNQDVIDCLITTYSPKNASFTGNIRTLESERDFEVIRAAKAWHRSVRNALRLNTVPIGLRERASA